MLQMKCEDVITLGTEPFFDLGGGPKFWKKIKEYMWGVQDWEAHVNIYVGLRLQSKEKPLIGQGKDPSRW